MSDEKETKVESTETKPTIKLGEFLKTEREKKNITIEQVASATKINVKLLLALESDNYEALPAKPFVRGFITSYTRYIGLDANEVLAEYDSFVNENAVKKQEKRIDSPQLLVGNEGLRDNKKTALTVVFVVCLVATFVAFSVLKPSLKKKRRLSKSKATKQRVVKNKKPKVVAKKEEKAPEAKPTATKKPEEVVAKAKEQAKAETAEVKKEVKEVAEKKPASETPAAAPTPEKKEEAPQVAATTPEKKPEEEKKVETTTEVKKPEATTPATTAQPQTQTKKKKFYIPPQEVKHVLIVRANEDCWVKYQSDEGPLKQYTLKAGQKIYIKARESIRFKPGYPRGIELSVARGPFKPYPYGDSTKTLIIPEAIESKYRTKPFFIDENGELSTVN